MFRSSIWICVKKANSNPTIVYYCHFLTWLNWCDASSLKTDFSVNLNRVESWKWPNGLCLRSTCPASAMIKCPPLLKAQTCIMQINLGPQSIMNHSCFSGEEGLRMASLEKRRAQAGQNVHCTIVCFSLTHLLNVAVFT